MPVPPEGQNKPKVVAAVDLGSNSFHLIVAELSHGELAVIDRLRESVRLGAGLDHNKCLTVDAQQRAIECLQRFGQRVGRLPPGSVRAVGTNALRQARNAEEVLEKAETALGHPVDIIGGREEARLVYLGVAHGLEAGDERRLVVDIGGGSTEIISGVGFEATTLESVFVGCVSLSRTWFADGRIKKKRMRRAILEAELAMQPVAVTFRSGAWQRAIGCSGTIRAIRDVVQAQGWCKRGITLHALEKLKERVTACSHIEELASLGVREDRLAIFPGGLVALWAVFELLAIPRMDISSQALREGVLYDLIGRIEHTDVRTRSVNSISERWAINVQHAERVAKTALSLLSQVAEDWGLDFENGQQVLNWAARLHEIGLLISHSQYHKHGAYVVANADLSGFSRREQAGLAALVRGHRRKFPVEEFKSLHKSAVNSTMHLCVLLRLAVLLHRSRELIDDLPLTIKVSENAVRMRFSEDWLDQHPLTVADLEQEQDYLRPAGYVLQFQ